MDMWFWKNGKKPDINNKNSAYYSCHSVAHYANQAIVGMDSCASVKVSEGDTVIMQSSYKKKLGT